MTLFLARSFQFGLLLSIKRLAIQHLQPSSTDSLLKSNHLFELPWQEDSLDSLILVPDAKLISSSIGNEDCCAVEKGSEKSKSDIVNNENDDYRRSETLQDEILSANVEASPVVESLGQHLETTIFKNLRVEAQNRPKSSKELDFSLRNLFQADSSTQSFSTFYLFTQEDVFQRSKSAKIVATRIRLVL